MTLFIQTFRATDRETDRQVGVQVLASTLTCEENRDCRCSLCIRKMHAAWMSYQLNVFVNNLMSE